MADPELTRRAERAYLGALLAGQGQAADGGAVLRAEDFSDPVHQAIYAALAGQAGSPGLLGRLRALLDRLFSRDSRAAARYMAELPDLRPDPASLPAYAGMIAAAARDRARQTQAHQSQQAPQSQQAAGTQQGSQPPQGSGGAAVLDNAGTWLDNAAPHASRRFQAAPAAQAAPATVPAAPRAAGPAPGVRRTARALRHAAARTAGQAPQPGPAAPDPGQPANRNAPGQQPPAPRADLERQILASLMQDPAAGRAVAAWLPASVFTARAHRDLFRVIQQRLADDRPVDPLIVAWDAAQLPARPAAAEYGGPAGLAQTALTIAALTPEPGTAGMLGRFLWADRILVHIIGDDWAAEAERVSRITAPHPAPAQTPAPTRQQTPVPTRQQTPVPTRQQNQQANRQQNPQPGQNPQPQPARPTPTAAAAQRRTAAPPRPAQQNQAPQVVTQPPPAPGQNGPVPRQ